MTHPLLLAEEPNGADYPAKSKGDSAGSSCRAGLSQRGCAIASRHEVPLKSGHWHW